MTKLKLENMSDMKNLWNSVKMLVGWQNVYQSRSALEGLLANEQVFIFLPIKISVILKSIGIFLKRILSEEAGRCSAMCSYQELKLDIMSEI